MGIVRYMIMAVSLLTDLVCIVMLRRNVYKLYMKNENGKVQSAEIKKWKAIYYLRPVFYKMEIEYVENGDRKQHTLISVSPFLKKYQKEKYIQITTIPGTDFVFPIEEKWLVQNIELGMVIVVLTMGIIPGMVLLLLAGFLETWLVGSTCFFLFLSTLFLMYKGFHPNYCRHKNRMKYVTRLSCEEVIERLGNQAEDDFRLKKEKENTEDRMYILSLYGRASLYRKCFCEKARYRVLTAPTQEGSAVWFYLSWCRNKYELNQYAEKLRRFMQEKIDAVRTE